MPQINLTTLSGQELRQRLDASRARGNATLAYEILREMETRRVAEEGRRRPFLKRRAAQPHLVEVDLSDPMEKGDDLPPIPHWREPEHEPEPALVAVAPEPVAAPDPQPAPKSRRGRKAAPAPEPEPEVVQRVEPKPLPRFRPLERPLSLREPEPSVRPAMDPLDLRLGEESPAGPSLEPFDLRISDEPLAPPPARTPRSGHGLRIAAGFAVGIACGAAGGWFASDFRRDEAPVAAPRLQLASHVAAPKPAVLQIVAAEAAPAVEAAPAPPVEAPVPPPVPETPPPEAAAPAPAPVEVAEAVEPEHPAPVADACAAQPTPADREICADPALQRLQRDLRRAYAAAMDVHEDRALLRERQLAWRDARNDVTDPGRLARLYEQRIRKLEAATAEARSLR